MALNGQQTQSPTYFCCSDEAVHYEYAYAKPSCAGMHLIALSSNSSAHHQPFTASQQEKQGTLCVYSMYILCSKCSLPSCM